MVYIIKYGSIIASRFVNICLFLETENVFNPDSEIHLMVLHLVYLPHINDAINAFVQEWNNHPVTSACHYTPLQLMVQCIVNSGNTGYLAVNVLLNRQDIDFLGVDEEGPIPEAQTANNVEVAEILTI